MSADLQANNYMQVVDIDPNFGVPVPPINDPRFGIPVPPINDPGFAAPIGKKYDTGKPRMDLVPMEALLEVARVLGFGANKYGDDNWKHVDNLEARYRGATLRHIAEDYKHNYDPETGFQHLAHAICSLMFILQYRIENTCSKV